MQTNRPHGSYAPFPRPAAVLFSLLSASMIPWSVLARENPGNDAPGGGKDAPVIAVLSADMAPYREALSGLREILGAEIPAFVLPGRPAADSGAKVFVAFGLKAASLDYPPGTAVITALTPGVSGRSRPARAGTAVFIPMTPPAETIIAGIKALQPGLKSLGVLWSGESMDFSVSAMADEAKNAGILLRAFRAAGPDEVPGALRALNGQVDALWLPLDPALLTERSFGIIKEYALNNTIPLYVPTEKLVSAGASASVFYSFSDIGNAAARTAEELLTTGRTEGPARPAKARMALNPAAAERSGLRFSEQTVKEADFVFR